MLFPIFLPILNDKIVIRLWDKKTFFSDIYIASVPEISSENDVFNINHIKS